MVGDQKMGEVEELWTASGGMLVRLIAGRGRDYQHNYNQC